MSIDEMNSDENINSDEEKELFDNTEIEISNIDSLEERMFTNVYAKLKKIIKKCDKYIFAHEYCKNYNYKSDRMVKILMLSFSTLATYFVNTTHTEELNETVISNNSTFSTFINGIDSDELFLDKNLTFAATIVTGINSIFNFSNRSDVHKNMVTDYIRLKNDIKIKLQTFDFGVDEKMELSGIPGRREFIKRMSSIYEKARNDITELKIRSNQIGLGDRIKRKSGLSDIKFKDKVER